MTSWVLAVHGGAGSLPPDEPDYEAQARRGVTRALALGARVLGSGGSAREAVVAAVALLEDDEVFNAGRGSVLTAEGAVEMDAAVMDGARGEAGAVAGVRRLANPVRAALAVLEHCPHVLLAGAGAESFAVACGAALVDPIELVTERRREQLRRLQRRVDAEHGHGTVGAVARDAAGHLAAATSTGGVPGKLPGRISDSCQIGAGTWADDATCAVSATGDGDVFIRRAFAHEVATWAGRGLGIEEACARALAGISAAGGRGGAIAIDASARIALHFDTTVMPRGRVAEGVPAGVAIRAGEPFT